MATAAEIVKPYIAEQWDSSVMPVLCEFVSIPNSSPHFDPEWETNGLMEKAMQLQVDWVVSLGIKGLKYEIAKEPGRTPFLFIEIDGTEPTKKTLMMYGHMDKQPPLDQSLWREGLAPYKPVLEGDRLYGRGAADDGYSIFSACLSIAAMQKHNIPHGRVVICIEAGEESGSPDLDYFVQEKYKERIGDCNLIICLDSGCQTYDRLWMTASLRGVCVGNLTVKVLREAIHSGAAGGVTPDTFRLMRQLLDRIEDSKTGEVLVKEAYCKKIPESVLKAMEPLRDIAVSERIPSLNGVGLEPGDNLELCIRNYWKPSITIVGDNLPVPEQAGNVIRPSSCCKISLRIPPMVEPADAVEAMKRMLEENPPYGAKVTFETMGLGSGFASPEFAPWLHNCLTNASEKIWGKSYACSGEGGSIPFMKMLQDLYPTAQFVVLGVLGPQSNAHGPNEYLHVPMVKNVTAAVAHIVAEHMKHAAK